MRVFVKQEHKHFCIHFHFSRRLSICSYLQPINTFARADNIDIDTLTKAAVYYGSFVSSFVFAQLEAGSWQVQRQPVLLRRH